MLVPWDLTVPPTTMEVTTTIEPLARAGEDGGGLTIRLPEGSWVWLLLIVPFFLGLFCVYLWYRAHKAAEWVDENIEGAKSDAVQTADRFGPFHIVARPQASEELPPNQKCLIKVVVEDLPLTKPLGLELHETKVCRVHAEGKVWGWQVGDTIVQIGSYPVSTFEEIWARIQVERDRLPCTFLVERQAQAPTYLDHRGEQKPEDEMKALTAEEHDAAKVQKGSKIAASAESSKLNSRTQSASAAGDSRFQSRLSTHTPTGRASVSSKLEEIREMGIGIPSLREAALAAEEEEEDPYSNFAQPSSQDWWQECQQRREAHTRKLYQQPLDLQDSNRVMENRRTLELTRGVTENITKDDIWKVMNEVGHVEDCHVGTRDVRGNFISLPWVRFRTVMAAEAAFTTIMNGEVHMVDTTKHGEDRFPVVSAERKQDRIWGVPAGMPGGTPSGAKHPNRDYEGDNAGMEPARAFGEWWTEQLEREDTPSESYGSDTMSQWQMDRLGTPPPRKTLWEEAREKDHHNLENAFDETLPYYAWLESDASMNHFEERGDVKEWVCRVCKRGNLLDEPKCKVCGSVREYRARVDLKEAAKPRLLLPDTGPKKTPDPKVVFKKDAWHRFVYDIKP